MLVHVCVCVLLVQCVCVCLCGCLWVCSIFSIYHLFRSPFLGAGGFVYSLKGQKLRSLFELLKQKAFVLEKVLDSPLKWSSVPVKNILYFLVYNRKFNHFRTCKIISLLFLISKNFSLSSQISIVFYLRRVLFVERFFEFSLTETVPKN